jgi:hypothetical protein
MIAMRRAQPIIRHCYERGLLRNPSLHGHVDLDVHVGPDGSVAGVRVRTRMRDPDIVACIGRTAAHLRLGAPSPPGDCAVLSAPFNFAPE